MTDDATARLRRRLAFRSWHRGTREADLILGSFADAHLQHFGETELLAYEAILDHADPDIYDWMTGRADPPTALSGPVLDRLCAFDPGAALKARAGGA